MSNNYDRVRCSELVYYIYIYIYEYEYETIDAPNPANVNL